MRITIRDDDGRVMIVYRQISVDPGDLDVRGETINLSRVRQAMKHMRRAINRHTYQRSHRTWLNDQPTDGESRA